MEAWVKENKTYLAAVVSIGLGTILYYFIVLSPIQDGAEKELKARQARERTYRSYAAAGVPEEPAVVQAEADVKAQGQKLDEMVKQFNLVLSDRFTAKKTGTYVEHFNMIKLEVRDEWQNLNVSANLAEFPAPDKLNFTSWTPESEAAAQDALRRLGVADTAMRIVIDSMEAGERIEALDIQHGSQQEEPDDLFLRRIPIQVKVVASSKSIFRIIHALQGRLCYVCPDHTDPQPAAGKCASCQKERIPRSYLCVDVVTITRSATTGQDSFEAEMVITGLRVDPAKPVSPPKSE